MTSTPSPLLALELMATGENSNTWGGKTNTNIALLEQAVAGRTAIALSSSNVTLTTTNYASDQSRVYCLALSGTLTANVSIIVPNRSHAYLVENLCTGSFTVTVKTAAGTGVVCGQNAWTAVYCNGTNVVQPTAGAADASTLGGISASGFAQLAAFNQFAKGSGHTFSTLSDGATVSVDCTLSDRFYLNIQGNRTLSLGSPADGQTIKIWVQQDATGGRTLTMPSNVSGSVSLAGAPNAITELELTYNLALDTWVVQATAAGAVSASLAANEANVRIFERVGSPSGVVTVNVTIAAGTRIFSLIPGEPALDLSGFASGSTVNLVNNGYIIGKGGEGGKGGMSSGAGNGNIGVGGAPGYAGGDAVKGPGSGITFNLYNGSGFIWGGGGGGGGGGSAATDGNNGSNGGGGGGGAGGGQGGGAGSLRKVESVSVSTGSNGSNGSFSGNGTGGSGGTGGSASAGTGGAGGDFGSAGSAGSSPSGDISGAGGAGGAAGKAVDVNGGTANFITGSGSPNVKGAVA